MGVVQHHGYVRCLREAPDGKDPEPNLAQPRRGAARQPLKRKNPARIDGRVFSYMTMSTPVRRGTADRRTELSDEPAGSCNRWTRTAQGLWKDNKGLAARNRLVAPYQGMDCWEPSRSLRSKRFFGNGSWRPGSLIRQPPSPKPGLLFYLPLIKPIRSSQRTNSAAVAAPAGCLGPTNQRRSHRAQPCSR